MKKILLGMVVVSVSFLFCPTSQGQNTYWYKNVPTGTPAGWDEDECEEFSTPPPNENSGTPPEGYDWVNCCPSCAQQPTGQASATEACCTESLDIGISTGRNKPGALLPGGLIRIKADLPSEALYTPQSIGFSLGMMISSITTNNLTSNGVPRQVTILNASCGPVTYEFTDNVATGLPTGKYSSSLDRLIMVNESGAPVLTSPKYYDLKRGNGALYRYGADISSEEYLGLVSYTSPYGRRTTMEDGGIKVIRDVANSIRQINVPQCLVDVVTLSPGAYEMRFYATTNRGTWNPSLGLFDSLGAPFVVFRLEDPEGEGTVRDPAEFRFSKIASGATNQYLR